MSTRRLASKRSTARSRNLRRRNAFAAAATLAAASLGTAAVAGTYTLITPYAGAGTSTSVLGINDAGYMTGSIGNADGSADGFIRDPSGAYTIFNDGYQTIGRNIDNSNNITGYATDATLDLQTDTTFLRSAGGTLTTLTDPNTSAPLHGIAQGQKLSGTIVGDYFYMSGGHNYRHGFALNGASFTDISVDPDYPIKTTARGVNDAGTIVGWTLDNLTGVTQGYVDVAGAFTFFSDPDAANASTTYFEDINDSGLVSGEFQDASGDLHPFLFNTTTDAFADLTPPGPIDDYAFGINASGEVVITSNLGPNYLYNPAGVPEPQSWAFVMLGVGLAGAALRRRGRAALTTRV
jgi:hypothetical protein